MIHAQLQRDRVLRRIRERHSPRRVCTKLAEEKCSRVIGETERGRGVGQRPTGGIGDAQEQFTTIRGLPQFAGALEYFVLRQRNQRGRSSPCSVSAKSTGVAWLNSEMKSMLAISTSGNELSSAVWCRRVAKRPRLVCHAI